LQVGIICPNALRIIGMEFGLLPLVLKIKEDASIGMGASRKIRDECPFYVDPDFADLPDIFQPSSIRALSRLGTECRANMIVTERNGRYG
jgi:hypothetical protein